MKILSTTRKLSLFLYKNSVTARTTLNSPNSSRIVGEMSTVTNSDLTDQEVDKKPLVQFGPYIKLKVINTKDGNEVFFRIMGSTKLKMLMDAYCEREYVNLETVKFLFYGLPCRGEQTPDELKMEDGDEIDVFFLDMLEETVTNSDLTDQEEDKKPLVQSGQHINIKVTNQEDIAVFFRIKRSAQLKVLMNAYCERQSLDFRSVRFLFDSRRLSGNQTPDQLKMEDGDDIQAFLDQLSGGIA